METLGIFVLDRGYLGYHRDAENQYPQVFDDSMSHADRGCGCR